MTNQFEHEGKVVHAPKEEGILIADFKFKRVDFIKQLLITKEFMRDMPPTEIQSYWDLQFKRFVIDFRTGVFVDRHAVTKSIEFDYPTNFWQHLKHIIYFDWPRWTRKLIRINPDKIKMQKKTREVEFIKDYFPDKPAWHKYMSDRSENGKAGICFHESIEINDR